MALHKIAVSAPKNYIEEAKDLLEKYDSLLSTEDSKQQYMFSALFDDNHQVVIRIGVFGHYEKQGEIKERPSVSWYIMDRSGKIITEMSPDSEYTDIFQTKKVKYGDDKFVFAIREERRK